MQGGWGGFGRHPGGGINGPLAVGEGDRGESMMTPGFGLGVLANAGTKMQVPEKGKYLWEKEGDKYEFISNVLVSFCSWVSWAYN